MIGSEGIFVRSWACAPRWEGGDLWHNCRRGGRGCGPFHLDGSRLLSRLASNLPQCSAAGVGSSTSHLEEGLTHQAVVTWTALQSPAVLVVLHADLRAVLAPLLSCVPQFCINLANEKLQQHFNQHVFKWEQVRRERGVVNAEHRLYQVHGLLLLTT